MILKDFVKCINDIKGISASIGLPLEIEQEKIQKGISGKLILGDMPLEKAGNIYDMTMNFTIQYKTIKKNSVSLLQKLQALSQKFSNDTEFLFGGWTKEDDETDLIYNGNISYKNIIGYYET